LALSRVDPRLKHLARPVVIAALLAPSVFSILLLHTAEAWSSAGLFLYLGEFESMPRALYFSIVTITTLGYGDVTLSPEWALLGAFEAMEGLILFAASTAFLFAVVRNVLEIDSEN
jgi:voltage-gated potassium channel Kch